MKTKSKFKVNDLVIMKFEVNNSGNFTVLEIKKIMAQSPCKGNTTLYLCRAIKMKRKYDGQYIAKHSLKENNSFKKYVEDELVALPKDKNYILINKCESD